MGGGVQCKVSEAAARRRRTTRKGRQVPTKVKRRVARVLSSPLAHTHSLSLSHTQEGRKEGRTAKRAARLLAGTEVLFGMSRGASHSLYEESRD